MKILIVHAHHEPRSFSSALARRAEQALRVQGHAVDFADLYAEKFDPVSDRRNFTTTKDAGYLKQQVEEAHASEVGGFAPALEREIRRLEACDALIFSFPIWWFGMPAILKGWVDRVFASVRIYGGPKIYETGLGKAQKRGLVLMTTGGGPDVYGGYGVNPPLSVVLAPVQHGVFWFNGFLPLAPFVAWSPARITPEDRAKYLDALEARLKGIADEPPVVLPPLADFPGWGKDSKKRFMVTVTRAKPADEEFKFLIPAEGARLAELKRMGVLLASHLTPPHADPWRGFLHMRETDADAVRRHLDTLPLAPWLGFEIAELAEI
jgi:NAD(P)H dehydrogenase (quinone)